LIDSLCVRQEFALIHLNRLVNEAHTQSQHDVVGKLLFKEYSTYHHATIIYNTGQKNRAELMVHSSNDVFNLLNAHRKLYLHIAREMLPSKRYLEN
jgi:hypothetical protein